MQIDENRKTVTVGGILLAVLGSICPLTAQVPILGHGVLHIEVFSQL